jgi:hypothetical protein
METELAQNRFVMRSLLMKRLTLTGLLAALLVAGATIPGAADSPQTTPSSASNPVVVRLALRDRTVVITSARSGRQYSVLGTADEILQADLSEQQFAEAYPEFAELLQPAIADPDSELMMLAPIAQ